MSVWLMYIVCGDDVLGNEWSEERRGEEVLEGGIGVGIGVSRRRQAIEESYMSSSSSSF